MDYKIFLSTFGAIFLAELGDKTQLAALALSSGSRSKWTVFVAAALALVATTAIAVLAGDLVSKHVSPIWIRRCAGAAFVFMGAWFLLRPGE
jgi:putative Ca2+/H+ antiporter (TMEM165/GDT1 family)